MKNRAGVDRMERSGILAYLLTHKKLAVTAILLITFEVMHQYFIQHSDGSALLLKSLGNAFLYTALLLVVFYCNLEKTSIAYLSLPYFFFIPGWLNIEAILILSPPFLYVLYHCLTRPGRIPPQPLTPTAVAGFLIIALWVNLSGAGGYGSQTMDYAMHNARLNDLIHFSWPVRYGENQNLVYYFGYFLPAAALGKLSSFHAAEHAMYFWTLLGVCIVVRWASTISGWSFSASLAILFALFGPMDILNVIYLSCINHLKLAEIFFRIFENTDYLDFSTNYLGTNSSAFYGNYLSNNFQLYWSPPQIIAGWITVGLLTHMYLERRFGIFFFVYALLSIWAPLVMIALAPLILLAFFTSLKTAPKEIFSASNIFGGILVLVFVIFYLAGSSEQNPSYWISIYHFSSTWSIFLASALFGWVIYAMAILSNIRNESRELQWWFAVAILALLLLPIRTFGEYSDLLCRGSAPLMFLIFAMLLRTVRQHWLNHRQRLSIFLLLLILPGIFSAMARNTKALQQYGSTQPVGSIIDYHNAYPNLGPDNTFFERYLRKKIP